jgi:hypothetical protein
MKCNHCGSEQIKKNGHTHYGKQNYLCHECNRQFVENGQDWFVNEVDKLLINKLLLERISLAGICRVCDISEKWLLSYVKSLYNALPDDLNADLTLPDIEAYLADRMDEEISRLSGIKKIQLYYKTIFSQQQLRKA